MVHPKRFEIGKPVEIWCNELYEPSSCNCFLPVDSFKDRIIFSKDIFSSEQVLVIIPVIE